MNANGPASARPSSVAKAMTDKTARQAAKTEKTNPTADERGCTRIDFREPPSAIFTVLSAYTRVHSRFVLGLIGLSLRSGNRNHVSPEDRS